MADEKLMSFSLVGGTALALKIGHRKSLDIDLFTATDFNSQEISSHLTTNYNVTRIQTITNGVFCLIDGVKLDLITHKYPLLEDLETVEGIRMVSLKDIGAMKLNAIYNNGTRLKDFVDIYALLETFPLKELLQASEKKYPENNIAMVKNALLHHEDIDFTVPIDYVGKEIKWTSITQRLQQSFHDPQKIFNKLPALTRELLEKKQRKEQKRKGPRL
ncbi:nucleotidyl transferase AbiEii/AbiGii toxin family protein [Agriterribacter humi]|uniref:nucleotidyl transferase AbiEii/AbiGii toxin family protein n=1 Tax=Agriterribacter humi TaxID=1104781 RepID=UPI00186ABEEB|nr:nucleotidyl transferase AbiEii/AbiGii toxin family protein [Agriterribacter humi]